MKIQSYKDLVVWQKSMDLVVDIYSLTNKLPKQETYGLASQIQRAAISIASNIAEGSNRRSRADFRRFCTISLGSAAEVETQLLLIERLYMQADVNNLITQLAEI